MKFENSQECMKSELDLFAMPSTQSSVDSGVWMKIMSESSEPGTSSSITFKIAKLAEDYIDMSQLFCKFNVSIRKIDESNNTKSSEINDADKIGPVNNFFHSMFNQVIVKLNGTIIENSNSLYAYKAYFANKFGFNKEEKESLLASELYYEDEPGLFNSIELKDIAEVISIDKIKINIDPAKLTGATQGTTVNVESSTPVVNVKDQQNVSNKGFIKRRHRFIESKQVEMVGKLKLDIATTYKYLLSLSELEIVLTKNTNEFCLIGDSTLNASKYKVYIHDATLFAKKISINPSLGIAIEDTLKSKSNAIYPYKYVKMNSYNISAGQTHQYISSIHNGTLPNRILVALVDQTSIVPGDLTKNPFNFETFDLSSIHIQCGGKYIPYADKLEFDYTNKNYGMAYNTIFNTFGTTFDSYEDYIKGNVIYAFNTTPDICTSESYNIQKTGEVTCTLEFQKKTPTALTVIFYLEIDNIFQINTHRVAIPTTIV